MRSRLLSHLLIAAAVAAAAAALAGCSKPAENSSGRYERANILLVTIDTQRADRVGVYGYERRTSPYIDKLAAEGIVFEGAFAPRAMTWPALATLITGRPPIETGVRMNGQLLPADRATIASHLRAAGYATAAAIGGSTCHLARQKGDFDDLFCGGDEAITQWAADYFVTDRDKPFFLWVHYMGPHVPYTPAREFDVFRDPKYAGPVRGARPVLDKLIVGQNAFTQADVDHLNALYDAEVLEVDKEISYLRAGLRVSSAANNTLIALTADHGEDLYDHNGYLFHSCSVYDSSLQVPLIVRLPDAYLAGTRHKELSELADVAPTLLDWIGVNPIPAAKGRSIVAALDGREPERAEWDQLAVSEYYNHKDAKSFLTLRTPKWRFVHNPDGYVPTCIPTGDYYDVGKESLYDMTASKIERDNVAEANPEVVERFRSIIRERGLGRVEGGQLPIQESLKGELRALGYIE